VDEVFFLTEALSMRMVGLSDGGRIEAEVTAALELFGSRGFIERRRAIISSRRRSTRRCFAPPNRAAFAISISPSRASTSRTRTSRPRSLARLRAQSHGARVAAPAPGTAASVARLRPRLPHGVSLADFIGFPAAWFHHELGLNVAFPVLPLHGRGRSGCAR
jgi:hypothetical protein